MAKRIRRVWSVSHELVKKAREAMLTAVQIYNNPQIDFKSELFIVTTVIAWTYLLHAYYRKQKIDYRQLDRMPGRKRYATTPRGAVRLWSLEDCLGCRDSPIDPIVKQNLLFLIGIRHDSPALRRFAGVDLGVAAAPDETTILRFRHLLEQHELCGKMLDTVNLYLDSKGIRISTGTIVDATLINAPSSTKNSTGQRDPEMHQTRKGQQWYFGAKAHIGVDSKEVVVHSVITTAASVADAQMLPDLLHGEEKKVWGDAGYQEQTEAIHEAAPDAQDMTNRRTKFKNYVDEEGKRKNKTKSKVRAKVEHPFRILKRVFGFTKVRYRGLKKNHEWLCAAFALVNLYQHRNRLVPQGA